MTVLSDLSVVSYVGDNVSTSFGTSPMVFFDAADIFVLIVTDATGVSVTLVNGTDYSITGGNGAVGTVNLAGGTIPHGVLLTGTTLILNRLVGLTQATDFVNGDQSDAEVLEKALDRLTMMAQQFDPALTTALKAPITELTDQRFLASDWIARASKVVGFDANKVLTVISLIGTGVLTVSAYIQTLLSAADAPSAKLTLNVVDSPNFTQNGDFEQWDAGTSAPPTGWVLQGAGATVAKNTTAGQFKYGLASAALTRAGADAFLYQLIDTTPGFGSVAVWKNKTVTFGAWVRATVASRARVFCNDGVGVNYSSYHSGGGVLEFITVTRTLDAASTFVQVGLSVDTGDTTAQFDGAVFVRGNYVGDFIPCYSPTTSVGLTSLPNLNAPPIPINCSFVSSVGASALTVAIKGRDGNDPSSTNPVFIPFRNVTVATGDYSWLVLTAATSFVVSSGSTLGAINATAFKLWLVAFNDAGTIRLGIINTVALATTQPTIYPLGQNPIASSTTEGGAGAADSAQVFYTGTGVTSKAYTVLGSMTWETGLATVGTWSAVATRAQLFGPQVPLPGAVVQVQRVDTGAVAAGSTAVPTDDTPPLSGEGDQFMSLAITPTSASHLLRILAQDLGATTAGSQIQVMSLYQDAGASSIKTAYSSSHPTTGSVMVQVLHLMLATLTASTTIKVRQGGAGTFEFNGNSVGTRQYGGVSNSYINIEEIAT